MQLNHLAWERLFRLLIPCFQFWPVNMVSVDRGVCPSDCQDKETLPVLDINHV